MTITQWPAQERPREKLIRFGAESLSDAELLAILLNKGTQGCNAIELARNLINHYGNLRKIFTSPYEQLRRHRGLGSAKYCQLQATMEVHRRILEEPIKQKMAITQPQHATDLLTARLCDCEREVFACLFLDSQYRVIRFEKLFYGSITRASVYPREVVKHALLYNAAAIIVAHNHPSGDAKPSQADREVTRALLEALELIEVQLLDHFVIGEGETVSLASLGWI